MGNSVERYAVERLRGQAPSIRTFTARDLHLDRPVTLWRPARPEDEGSARAFLQAALGWSRVYSPYVVVVHDVSQDAAGPFLVTAPAGADGSGAPLPAWSSALAQASPPDEEARRARLIARLAEALASAHAAGQPHGDLRGRHVRVLPGDVPQVEAFGLFAPVGGASLSADMRALGALSMEIYTGMNPGDDPGHFEAAHSLDLPLEILSALEELVAPGPTGPLTAEEAATRWSTLADQATPHHGSAPRHQPPRRPTIHIVDAALQDGPITDKPTAGLLTQCQQAAEAILTERPALRDQIEAVYLGTMGVTPGGAPGEGEAIHPTHIPNALRARLGLTGIRGGGYHTHMSTSESGAVALLKAVRDLQAGRRRTVLVVAGEAIFSGDPDRRALERRHVSARIKSVVDPHEGAYALSMLNVGDLLMDHLISLSGLPTPRWREALARITLEKYAACTAYPRGMEASKVRRRGPLGAEGYRDEGRNRWVTPHYRLHDVCPNANGATAVVLSVDPALSSGVQILGMGEGHTKVALTERSGPLGRPSAVRRAFRQLCQDAAVHHSLLLDDRWTMGIFHDAFPAVEAATLAELDPEAGWPWRMERLLTGGTNPLGGLSASGHALGNSGLLQIAQAFHTLTDDPRHLTRRPPRAEAARLCLVTSVGAALTNVISTLVARADTPEALERLEAARGSYDEPTNHARWRRPALSPALRSALASVAPDEGIVMARTRVIPDPGAGDPRWVHFVRMASGATLAMSPDAPTEYGARVRVTPGTPHGLEALGVSALRPPHLDQDALGAIERLLSP